MIIVQGGIKQTHSLEICSRTKTICMMTTSITGTIISGPLTIQPLPNPNISATPFQKRSFMDIVRECKGNDIVREYKEIVVASEEGSDYKKGRITLDRRGAFKFLVTNTVLSKAISISDGGDEEAGVGIWETLETIRGAADRFMKRTVDMSLKIDDSQSDDKLESWVHVFQGMLDKIRTLADVAHSSSKYGHNAIKEATSDVEGSEIMTVSAASKIVEINKEFLIILEMNRLLEQMYEQTHAVLSRGKTMLTIRTKSK